MLSVLSAIFIISKTQNLLNGTSNFYSTTVICAKIVPNTMGSSVLTSFGYEVTINDLQNSPSLYPCLSKLECGISLYITGGVLMEKFNFWFLLSCSLILACPCTVVISNFHDVIVVGLFVALSGFFYGIVICGESQLAPSSFYSPQFT